MTNFYAGMSLLRKYQQKPPRWRRWLMSAWRKQRWLLLGILWLVTLGLGYVGYAAYSKASGQAGSSLDLLYKALQLFTMQSSSGSQPKTLALQIAQLLAPAVSVLTVVRGLATLFTSKVQELHLRHLHHHVIVCGLGRKGFLLTRLFRESDVPVVVIERDRANLLLDTCHDLGAQIVLGDATVKETLQRAGVERASYVVAGFENDGDNAKIAISARDLADAQQRNSPLVALIHVVDPELRHFLRERELWTDQKDVFRLEFFNVYEHGARILLQEVPPFGSPKRMASPPPHLIVVGAGRLGQSLIVNAARDWWATQQAAGRRLRVTIVDHAANHKAAGLKLRFPQLASACDLTPVQMDVQSPDFHEARFLFDSDGRLTATAIYVCLGADSLGLMAALTLLSYVRGQDVPVAVRMVDSHGLAVLLQPSEDNDDWHEQLHPLPLLERTCLPEMLLGGTLEILARAMHERYLEKGLAMGQTRAINPSLVPWDELPEGLRESNRRQAEQASAHLHDIGCTIGPLTDWDAEAFRFTDGEIEQMARLEHVRFVTERLRGDWSYAQGRKNLARTTSPTLVHWDELSEDERQKDRAAVRALPTLLAQVGVQVYRLPSRHGGDRLPTTQTAIVPEVGGVEDTFSERLNVEVN
ncbi:NAD(P)-binding protein [Candidatus Amarolinea dominans]|uniref:NAD(P)-binding protein n=1 Tax=Candidatus Amarolinea dominans TaxID=3140696 RepID=UPI00313488EA|nr:NAD-binding protein [Anaerolineae bacterium]